VEAIINSMTTHERDHPDCLNDSRINRISRGCGQPRQKVVELIGRFKTMRQIMQGLGMGKKKVLGKLGVNPSIANALEKGAPRPPKKNLVDLKRRKDKKKAAKKAKKRNR